MNESILNFESRLQAAAKAGLPLPEREFVVALRKQIGQGTATTSRPGRLRRTLVPRAASVVFLLMVVLVTLLGPSDVLAAIQRFAGYIPGIGFIRPELILTEPISLHRGDATITVENLVVSSDESILVFTIKDTSHQAEVPISSYRDMDQNPYLQTSDGTMYLPLTGQGRLANGNEWLELVHFPALPPDTTRVFLMMDIHLPNGSQETLQFELTLEGGQPSSESEDTVAGFAPAASAGLEVSLNGSITEEDQLMLNLVVDWEDTNWLVVEVANFWEPTPKGEPMAHFAKVTDANGLAVPISLNMMESSIDSEETLASFVFSSDIPASQIAFPATLTLDAMYVSSSFSLAEEPVFSFTPKTEVIPGECESLLQPISNSEVDATLVKVCYLPSGNSLSLGGGGGGAGEAPLPEFGIELWFSADPDIIEMSVGDLACRKQLNYCAGSASIARGLGSSELLQSIHLYSTEPDWPVEFSVAGVHFMLIGPWSIEFELTE